MDINENIKEASFDISDGITIFYDKNKGFYPVFKTKNGLNHEFYVRFKTFVMSFISLQIKHKNYYNLMPKDEFYDSFDSCFEVCSKWSESDLIIMRHKVLFYNPHSHFDIGQGSSMLKTSFIKKLKEHLEETKI